MSEGEQFGRLWGWSDKMRSVFRLLREVAGTETTVLIQGETGTGKELAGEALHEHSKRASGPYMVVDCAAVPKELIESELFGHVRGAFTSALVDRPGAFEAADGGTVFIDEIGELPLELQARILRVLERRQVKRVGSNTTKSVSVRVVAATNRDLETEVERGRFRRDLYFRLNVVKVTLPSLRERPEDVEHLVQMFLAIAPTPTGQPLEIRPDDLKRLLGYHWPGNVRELRNIIDRGASISDRYFRVPEDLERSAELHGIEAPHPDDAPRSERHHATQPSDIEPLTGAVTEPLWRGKTFKDARDAVVTDFEHGYVTALLREHNGNVSAAARGAGIHRNILHRMMARYGISR